MRHTFGETDPSRVEQEVPATIDPNIRLLCYFTAQQGKYVFNLQIYTRKRYNFSDNRVINTRLPGKLGRLPPEIRFMIYDHMVPANWNNFDLNGTSARKRSLDLHRPFFAVPSIAHVCQDMRQYAMSKYQFIWWNCTPLIESEQLKTSPGFILNGISDELTGEISVTRIWNEVPKSKLSRFGFFDPKKDSLEIHLRSVRVVQLVKNATVEWDDAFQEPKLTNVSTRVKRYSQKEAYNAFVFTPKESGMWQSLWKGAWVKNRKPPVLV
ncbi:hypothetical protein F4679DRAFT_25950 [Xylaria curta]|nr:hypothetical protein F4679DRAFT_25950 [Xylaria curta]